MVTDDRSCQQGEGAVVAGGAKEDAPLALVVAYRDFALANSRLPLIAALRNAGYHVVAAAAEEGYREALEGAGATVEVLPFVRGGYNARGDGRAVLELIKLFRRYRPALVHLFNGKPVVLGSVVALAFRRAEIVSTITGMGYQGNKGGLSARFLGVGYRLVGQISSAVIFQNRDDREEFWRRGWVGAGKSYLVVSSGVDTRRFFPGKAGAPSVKERPSVLMVARLTRQKGVQEFLEAARQVRKSHAEVEFVLGGEWSSHPDGVEKKVIEGAVERRDIRFVGYVEDMPGALHCAEMFVLPSFYAEGVPRVLLEAAACGLAVIAADVPGSREVVREGETGLLVPARDAQALAEAIMRLARDPALRERMGKAGREMAEEEFDLKAVTGQQLQVYREIGVVPPGNRANKGAGRHQNVGDRYVK